MPQTRIVSVERRIEAAPSAIFDLLADPAAHCRFDGSGTVVAASGSSPDRLSLGARFGMSMRLGVPYRISNEVVEFEEDRRIAWRHLGHHIWRYELEPIAEATADEGAGATLVTESFDWSRARFPPFYEWMGYPARHRDNMAKTLERLAGLVETG